jgi:DNA-binding transcriptional MerR regulator
MHTEANQRIPFSEAAKRLGVPPSTLRKYSRKVYGPDVIAEGHGEKNRLYLHADDVKVLERFVDALNNTTKALRLYTLLNQFQHSTTPRQN